MDQEKNTLLEWSDEQLTQVFYGAISQQDDDAEFEKVANITWDELQRRGKLKWAWKLIDKWDDQEMLELDRQTQKLKHKGLVS